MDFAHKVPLYALSYPSGYSRTHTSFLMYNMNRLGTTQTKGNKPPRSAAKKALFPDAVAPLTIVNVPEEIFMSRGPSSNLAAAEPSDSNPGHRNIAFEKPGEARLSMSKGRGSTVVENEEAQSSTSSSRKKASMRCKETYATHHEVSCGTTCFQSPTLEHCKHLPREFNHGALQVTKQSN